jgi:hypothetical protein
MMNRGQQATDSALVDRMAQRSSADLRQFFARFKLDEQYQNGRHRLSKRQRIRRAFEEADRRSIRHEVTDAARRTFQRSRWKVFISHASADRELAITFKDALVLGGVSPEVVFFSSEPSSGVPPGESVIEQLQEAINETRLFVPLISEAYLRSPYCEMEYERAIREQDLVHFPILIGHLTREDVTRRLGNVQLASLRDERDIDTTMARMFDELITRTDVELRLSTWNDAVWRLKDQLRPRSQN